MKKLLLTLFIPFFTYANGNNLKSICTTEKGVYLSNRVVLEYNVTRAAYVNYRLSGEGSVWYFLHAEDSPVQGINFQYDVLKVAYLTQQPVNICLYSDGNTLGLERRAASGNIVPRQD